MNFKKVKFKFVDKLTGKNVYWFNSDYDNVVAGKGHNQHPEIVEHIDLIQSAIENPFMVRRDKDYERRYCYYNCFPGIRQYPRSHMKVVVKKSFRGTLSILTAYFTESINSKEELLYGNEK